MVIRGQSFWVIGGWGRRKRGQLGCRGAREGWMSVVDVFRLFDWTKEGVFDALVPRGVHNRLQKGELKHLGVSQSSGRLQLEVVGLLVLIFDIDR